MLRGVNKLIVEINNPESDYFERAIFFVKPSKGNVPTFELADNADYLLKNTVTGNPKKKKNRGKAFLRLFTAACFGALITVILLQLL